MTPQVWWFESGDEPAVMGAEPHLGSRTDGAHGATTDSPDNRDNSSPMLGRKKIVLQTNNALQIMRKYSRNVRVLALIIAVLLSICVILIILLSLPTSQSSQPGPCVHGDVSSNSAHEANNSEEIPQNFSPCPTCTPCDAFSEDWDASTLAPVPGPIALLSVPWTSNDLDELLKKMERVRTGAVIVTARLDEPNNETMRDLKVLNEKLKLYRLKLYVEVTVDSVSTDSQLFLDSEAEKHPYGDYLKWRESDESDSTVWKLSENRTSTKKYYHSIREKRATLNYENENVTQMVTEYLATLIRNGAIGIILKHYPRPVTTDILDILKEWKTLVKTNNDTTPSKAVFATSEAIMSNATELEEQQTKPGFRFDLPSTNEALSSMIVEDDTFKKIMWTAVNSSVWPAIPMNKLDSRKESHPMYWWIFSLFLPATPIIDFSNIAKIEEESLYSKVMNLREVMMEKPANYKTDIFVYSYLGKLAISRYSENKGYMVVFSYVANPGTLDLKSLKPYPANVTILDKSYSCNKNEIQSTVDASSFSVANVCILLLSFE